MAMFRWGGTSIVSPSVNDWAPNLFAQPETSVLPIPEEENHSPGFTTIPDGALTFDTQQSSPSVTVVTNTIITPGTGGGIILASDNFNRADGGLGASYHSLDSSALEIRSNQVREVVAPDGNDGIAAYTAITWPDNQYSKIKIIAASANRGVYPFVRSNNVVFASGAGSMYFAYIIGPLGSSVTLILAKFIDHAYTELFNSGATKTINVNDILEIRAIGTTISVWLNGVQQTSQIDGSLTTGYAGFGIADFTGGSETEAILDDWEGGSPSDTAGAFTGLAPTVTQISVITPSIGALTLTGFAATVSSSGSGQTITPIVGSLVITSNQPIQAFTLLSSSGSLTITGQQVTPITIFLIIPGADLLVLTPFAPGILTNILPANGALTITGPPTGITTTIITGVGTLTLTGIQGTVALATQLTPATGTLVFTGVAPTVIRTTVFVPSVGSLVLIGTAAGIQTTIFTSIGTLSLAGTSPVENTTIIPSSGLLSLSTNSSTLTTTIIPSVGSLVLTGFAPSVTKIALITPSVGSVVLTAAASTLTTTIIPSAGTLVLTGFPAAIPGGPPGSGSIVLTGVSPQISTTMFPNAGTLAFTSIAATRTITTVISPNVGSVSFNGVQSTLVTTIIPITNSLTFAGVSSVVTTNKLITPQSGTLVTTTIAPLITVSIAAIIPSTGILTLTGNSIAQFFVAGTNVLNLSGQVPTVAIRSPGVGGFFYFFSLT